MMKKNILVIFTFILFLLCIANAEEKTIVAVADPWPPYLDEKNPDGGLTCEIIRAAFNTQGYNVKLILLPWIRAEDGVKKGHYDLLLDVWMTETRKTYLLFSRPFFVNEIKFIKRKSIDFEFKNIESLTGYTIGTIRGYGYNDAFLKATNFKREEAKDLITNVKKVIQRRIDLTLDDQLVATTIINKEDPNLFNEIEFAKGTLSTNNLYIASGLKNPKSKEYIEAFNKGLNIIKSNGTFKKIEDKYKIIK